MLITIVVANQKGGVGKTTTALNLAASLSAASRKVLLIDLDSQGNSTTGIGKEKAEGKNSLVDVLIEKEQILDLIIQESGYKFDLIPASSDLISAEIELSPLTNPTSILRNKLEQIKDKYDYTVIDCPPSLGMLSVSALRAASKVLIPLQCEYYSLEGLAAMDKTIKEINEATGENIEIDGILRTMYDSRIRLGALLGNEEKPKETASDASNANTNTNTNAYASVDKISAGRFQARTDITQESLEELKDSIKSQGVIQPLIVRKSPSGDYELVAGERRLRASKMAGLEEVPIVIKNLSDEEIIKMGLIENLQREDLNPLDEARGIQRLQKEFNLTQEDLGLSLGKSRTAITNSLRLLQLTKAVQKFLEDGSITMGQSRPLLGLPEGIQESFAKKIIKNSFSSRQSENLVKQYQTEKEPKPIIKKDANLLSLETELSDALGSKVTISHQKKGSGKIIFSYKNLEQLDSIIKPLRKKE